MTEEEEGQVMSKKRTLCLLGILALQIGCQRATAPAAVHGSVYVLAPTGKDDVNVSGRMIPPR